MSARALALWCVLVVAVSARAAAYTVDCNHEYTDCDTELSKITGEEDDVRKPPVRKITSEEPKLLTTSSTTSTTTTTSTTETTTTEHRTETETEAEAEAETDPETDPTPLSEVGESIMPPQEGAKTRARLLNLNVDELQNFAIALHNETNAKGHKKHLSDLSDVNLDVDDDDEPRMIPIDQKQKDIPEKFYTNLQAPFHPLMTAERGSEEMDTCKENEITYKIGERMDRGCEETCECIAGGIFDCSPRCKHPYIRRGRRLNDPLCFESPVDECCSIIACATGSGDNSQKVVKPEVCRYGNDTHPVGSQWNMGCEQTCICEPNSIVTCKPRCNPLPVSDKCINVQDPNDACCEVQVCDVSHDVHEEPENSTTSTTSTTEVEVTIKGFEDYEEQLEHIQTRPLVLAEPIGSVKVLQNNSVQVNLMHLNESEDPIHLLLSNDGGKSFSDVELKYSNLILNLEGGKDYILKTKETGTKFNFTITASDNGGANEVPTHVPDVPSEVPNEVPNEDIRDNVSKIGCVHEGQFYEIGDEFHIGCTELCECVGPDQHECAALVCPSHVGLELVSKGCVRWAPSPPATPPNCCPRSARCLSDGTCHYKGVAVPNWSEVPISLTGCEQRCFCENGDLDCQDVCSPLPAVPPQTLRCPPGHRPAAVNISDEDCCKQWGCVTHAGVMTTDGPHQQSFLPTIPPDTHYPPDESIPDYDQNNIHRPISPAEPALHGLPPGLTLPPGYGDLNKKLTVISMQADSPTSVKMLFGLPPVLVGLRGSVDLRYTDKADEDITNWFSQVFAPADEVLTTPRLEFTLTGLTPATTYKIRGKLYLHNLPVEPESEIYTVRTLDSPTTPTVEEKRREIDSRLTVVDVNDTTAHVSWRRFLDDELQFIDAIQVRYRPVGTPIYSMTELLHHSRSTAELIDLRPGSRYEASLVLVPPPKATTELTDPGKVEFTTAPYVDPYNWTVTISARSVGSGAAEVSWRGVPAPAERWARVFRAAHACGGAKEHDAFSLAARDLSPVLMLTGLQPNSKCRIWLEIFLTNGKVKTSNVLEITTKSEDAPETVDNEVEASSVAGRHRGDYYGALVGVGAVAALGALTSLLLLLVVLRRHRPRSVPITTVPSAPRESSLPPYDNPAYKLELQQETMDL
ncbi:putative epidermal cell surface receptor isoform X1 [Helicoverpa zea]|uniref:putative epidermal cell surface receptor isoform X1 n=1 Tax=Helicoverpa zea TaxID=7113 RepID=UPI001F58C3B9|nr:putative epidermal cell surface receptor isoform X1 [Helicoverpa zea]